MASLPETVLNMVSTTSDVGELSTRSSSYLDVVGSPSSRSQEARRMSEVEDAQEEITERVKRILANPARMTTKKAKKMKGQGSATASTEQLIATEDEAILRAIVSIADGATEEEGSAESTAHVFPTHEKLQLRQWVANNEAEVARIKKDAAEIVKSVKTTAATAVSWRTLFKFADAQDWALIVVGFVCACAHGCAMPLTIIFFGDIFDVFDAKDQCSSANSSDAEGNSSGSGVNTLEYGDLFDGDDHGAMFASVTDIMIKIMYVAAAAAVTSFFQVACFVRTSQRQGTAIRTAYFTSLLRQEIGWYDTIETGTITSRLTSDVSMIQAAMSDKLGTYWQVQSTFISGLIIAFIYSWKLTLVIFAFMPLLMIGGAVMASVLAEGTEAEQKQYATAGGIANEALTLIRSVVAFGTASKEVARYDVAIRDAAKDGKKTALTQGYGMGFTFLSLFSMYALAMWYGGVLVGDCKISAGDVTIVFFCILMGGFSAGQAAPATAAFAQGKGAAREVFRTIERQSKIDGLSTEGTRPEKLDGGIEFKDVSFAYPTRKDQPVFDKLNLSIEANTSVAFVGESGCGKSTLVGLLERFYDPTDGAILLDGQPISGINIQWLRSHISLVAQQPVLFPTSIFENIAAGKADRDSISREELEEAVFTAAQQANAHEFIMSFQDKYETQVGDAGARLSGGQKQRVAIARALINNPRILLLDEATSALDSRSEKVVQQALEELQSQHNKTTITIAHRLSTIRKCDKIIVVGNKGVIEQGTHEELLQAGGMYAAMDAAQKTSGEHTDTFGSNEKGDGAPVEGAIASWRSDTTGATKIAKKDVAAAGTDGTSAGCCGGSGSGNNEDDDEEEKDAYSTIDLSQEEGLFKWALNMSRPEWGQIAAGIVCSMGEGLLWPGYAVLLTQVIAELVQHNRTEVVRNYCIGFFGIGVFAFVMMVGKFAFLGNAGNNLTRRLRELSFNHVLSQQVGYFDHPSNSKGRITMRLSTDSLKVRGLIGDRLGGITTVVFTLFVGIGIGFYYCPQESGLMLSTFPILAFFSGIQLKMMTGFSDSKEFESSSTLAGQVVENIRTVVAMGAVKSNQQMYSGLLDKITAKLEKQAIYSGILFGMTEAVMLGVWGLSFYYGAYLVDADECTFDEMYTSSMAVILGAMMGGQVVAAMPDSKEAAVAAARIRRLIGEDGLGGAVPEGYSKPKGGVETVPKSTISGRIEFKDVTFTYPSRPETQVLKGISFTVEPGETVAFVGASGCGKSTIMSLIEGFYNHDGGQILVDGKRIESIEPSWLRKQMGLVQQEPQLFSMSIGENISYGLDTMPTTAMLEEAAGEANALEFVMRGMVSRWRSDVKGKNGFDTAVGEKGISLSGGQRQRVAIARAIVRKDALKVLLLDEATSALDTKSERVVQGALDRAAVGRSTLIIAHRLSTIQNADKIIVMDNGRVIDQGTHAELSSRGGPYQKLLQAQK